MKKTIILSIALVCVALGTSLSSYLAMRENLSSMTVANIEALTLTEAEAEAEAKKSCYVKEGCECSVCYSTPNDSWGFLFYNMTFDYSTMYN